MVNKKLLFIFFINFTLWGTSFSQEVKQFRPTTNRILFLLDYSGSMREKWGERTYCEAAKDILFKLVDSLEVQNSNVEFALRVFGAQYPREQKRCNDSKLFVPFAKNNAAQFQKVLSEIKPQGMTPIAYSLEQGALDFPKDENALNALILISDGIENCEGNPCKMAALFSEKRISLRPFIVGLNMNPESIQKLDCVGKFINAKVEDEFKKAVGVIIHQTLNSTTLQINLLDFFKKPTITNLPFTLYDHTTRKPLYSFIHALDSKGNPDTLYLNPTGIYDLQIHTFPPVWKENIELNIGKHNIIGVEVPIGNLKVNCQSTLNENDAQIIVRKKGNSSILNVQELNEDLHYLKNNYSLETLTNPITINDSIQILEAQQTNLSIPNFGTLNVNSNNFLILHVMQMKGRIEKEILRHDMKSKTEILKLQPGKYLLVYKPKTNADTEKTKTLPIEIEEGKTLFLSL